MSLPFRTSGIPQAADWEWHKAKIKCLYMQENLPLKEVAKIMQEDHGFRATTKMYKTHFQRWGFRKNLKASEGKVFEAQAVAGEEINLPVAYGRRLGSKRLKSRALRSNKQSSVTVALSPLRPIDAPDRLHLADNSLRAVAAYVNSRCDHWKSGHYSQWKTETGNWQQKMDLAAWQISEGQDMASSFQILNNACDEYKTILLMQEPVLLWATYDAILQLLKVDPNLARPFIKLVTGYCSYLRKNPTYLEKEITYSSAEVLLPMITYRSAKKMHDLIFASPEITLRKLNVCIEWIQELDTNVSTNIALFGSHLMETYKLKSVIHKDPRKWTETWDALGDAMRLMEDLDDEKWIDPCMKVQHVKCCEIKSTFLKQLGAQETAESYQEQAVSVALECLPEHQPSDLSCCYADTTRFHIRMGNIIGALATKNNG
ncbi:hypothetical protein TruAng_010955 [Truncatella angustata]|nr:hypothetical protein TruAng_010955 [Truncatella angustata]